MNKTDLSISKRMQDKDSGGSLTENKTGMGFLSACNKCNNILFSF